MKYLSHLLIASTTIILISTLVGCAGNIQSTSDTRTTIILTRHAERTSDTKVLTEYGRARAQDLVKAAGNMNITAIYSPDLERNLDTAKPLAKHLGLKITVVDKNPVAREVVKTMLDNHPGEVVLWVGNVTNLTEIYNRLGGDGDPPDNYGDIFIMKIKDKGFAEVIKDHYGAP